MSDDQFAKLSKLIERFGARIDKKVDALHDEFGELRGEVAALRSSSEMNDESLRQLYEYVEDRFNKQAAELSKTQYQVAELKIMISANSTRIGSIYDLLDGLAKRFDTDDVERAAINSQLDRHQEWMGQLSENTGTKLVPRIQT